MHATCAPHHCHVTKLCLLICFYQFFSSILAFLVKDIFIQMVELMLDCLALAVTWWTCGIHINKRTICETTRGQKLDGFNSLMLQFSRFFLLSISPSNKIASHTSTFSKLYFGLIFGTVSTCAPMSGTARA